MKGSHPLLHSGRKRYVKRAHQAMHRRPDWLLVASPAPRRGDTELCRSGKPEERPFDGRGGICGSFSRLWETGLDPGCGAMQPS